MYEKLTVGTDSCFYCIVTTFVVVVIVVLYSLCSENKECMLAKYVMGRKYVQTTIWAETKLR